MSGENIDLDAEIEKLTSRYGEDTILKLLMQKKRSEICKEPAAVKRRRSKTPSRKKSSDKETSESTAEESLRPFSSEEERIIQNIESGSFSAISTSTTEDSSEYSDSFPQDQAAIKSQDEAMSAVKKKKTPHISKARKSIDKDNGPSTAKDSLKRRLSMDKLTVTDVGVSGLVASKEIPYVPPATVERRRCSSPLSSVSPGKKRKQENEDEPNKERKKGDLNYSCSVTLERISVGNIVKPKPDSKQRKPMPKSVRERLELKNRKPSESKEPEMVAGASDLKLKVPMKVVKTKEHKESERAAGASESKFEIPMKNAIPKEGKEPEIAAGASEFKFKIPKKVTVPKASKEPEIAARASESKFKIPMKVTIPKVSKEPEIAAGASEPKFKKPMNAPISKEHNVLSSKLGKKSKASVKKCEVGPVRKDHRVQESVKNREMQPGGSGKGQHNVPTKGRMKYEVPPKVSATKEHQVTDKEPSPKTCLAPANENSTQETSAYEHNFLLPSVPAKRLPKAKAQTSLSNRLSDGFCNFHNAKVDEAKMDPLEKIKLEDQDLDYEEDATDNDDAISLFAESIFVIEESEDNLLRKIKHDDCDDDSSIASCGSSRHTSDIDISDSENEETQSFGAVEKENNSEVLVHQADEVSASFKAPVLGVPVENYYKDTHTSDSVDHLFNQNLNTKACKEVSLESDKPSCKRTICDVDRSENMKDVSSSSCANTVSNEQSCDQRFENYICRRDETTQQQIDTGIESSYQSADSENSAFPIVCQNKPPFSKGVHKPVNHRENRPLQTSPSRIQTEKSQTERIGLLNSSTIHPVPQNPRQPLLPTPEIQYPMVTNMPTERTNYPSTDSSSVYPFPTHSSSSGVADTMSNCGEKDMVDHLMLSKTDSDLRTMVATNSRISSCVPSIGQGMAEFLRPFCLEYLAIGKCKSVKSCPQAHKLPDVRNFVSLRDRSFLRQIFDTMISNYEFWMENKLPGEVQELGNENNRNLLFAISSFLWKKLTSEGTSKKYSLLWKNVADALSACGLSPNKVLKQILSSMEKESTTTNYYLTQALDNMFEVLFDDYIKDQDLIGESLKALNLTDYQIPEKVLKEFLKAVLKFKSVDLPVCHYLLTLPEKWRPKKLVEHDIYHLIIKLASKLHIESPKICSDLMNHFDISLQSLSIPRSCSDSSLPKKRDGKSTHRFSLQCVDLNVEGQGQGSDISSSNRVTPEEPAVSCGSATMCSSTREEEVTSSTEEIKTKEQTPDLVVAKTQPEEEAHQSKSAFTDKISIKVETGSTKRICSVLTPKPNPLDVKIVKKTAPKAGGKPSNWVMAVKRKMMGIVAKNLLAWRPTNQVRSLDAEIYEEFRKFPAAERCSMYKQLFERIESLWSPNRDDSHSKAAMIRIGLLLVNDLVSERLWQEADDVLSKINPLMEVTSEVEIESISTSTMMLMKVQVNLHNSKLLTAFQEFMVLELFKRKDNWLIPNLEEDVGRRDEVASDLLEKCMDSEEFVDKGEILFREMLTFKDSYKKFDVASKFYDKVLLSLLKIKNVEAAFDLFGWASDHGLSPNTTTCRCLCLNIMELERNVQLRLSPHIVHLMELQPYRYAIPQHELDHLQSARTIIITLPSIWFSCEVRCILHYFLNAHMSKLPEFQNFPEVVLNIQEIPAPEEVPYGLTAVDSSSSAMMDRVVQVLKQFNLVGPTIQFKDNSITLDGELVKEYVAVRRNSFRTDQQTVSRCLSTRGQHILGARPVSHMPWQDRRGAERQQFERAPNHEGYGYSQPGPGFEARQQTAFSNRPQPLLSTPPLMLDQPQQGANWSPAPNHPYSFPQQARQDQETNWSQLTPSNNQPFLDYQPNFAPRPSYNLRNSYPPFGPPQGTFRGSGRKRGANRGGRRPARYLH